MLKFAANKIGIFFPAVLISFISSSLKPVVPIIMGIFISRHLLSIFNVEIGFEKSITTSELSKVSSIMYSNLLLLLSRYVKVVLSKQNYF